MQCATERAGQAAQDFANETQEMISQRPLVSAATAFGLGVGAGLAVLALFGEQLRQPSTSERLGRKLMDALSSVNPRNLVD